MQYQAKCCLKFLGVNDYQEIPVTMSPQILQHNVGKQLDANESGQMCLYKSTVDVIILINCLVGPRD
jgi:hypothetical protein